MTLPRTCLILIVACLTTPPAIAQPDYHDAPGLPDSPQAKIAAELLNVVNSDDPQRITQFINQRLAPEFRDAFAINEHVDAFRGVYRQSQGLELVGLRTYDPPRPDSEMTVILRNKLTDAWEAVVIDFLPDEPYLIAGIRFAPARPPQNQADDAPLTQAEAVKALQTYVERMAKRDAFSGAVLLAKDGQILFKAAYGEASKRFHAPNKTDTKFNLGSMNKMFTAVAVAILAERGQLSFDDPIGKYLDESWLDREYLDKITIHQLLTHTAGLGSYFNDVYWNSSRLLFRELDDYKPLIRDEVPAFEPGSQYMYSNTGLFLAGVVVEKVSGQSYFDFVRDNLFKPAGMMDTDSYEMDKPVPNLAIGYSRADDGWENNIFKHVVKGGPAGGGFSTVEDLLRFDQAMRNEHIVSQKSLELLWTAKPETNSPDYGYGFAVYGAPGDRIVGHAGGFPGISSELNMYLDRGYTVAVMSNYDNGAQIVIDKTVNLLNRITPGHADAEQNPEPKPCRAGLKLRSQNGQIVITAVIPGSAADDAGLKTGDVILKVNAQSPDRIGPDKMRALFSTPKPVDLKIERDGETLLTEMTPKPAQP